LNNENTRYHNNPLGSKDTLPYFIDKNPDMYELLAKANIQQWQRVIYLRV